MGGGFPWLIGGYPRLTRALRVLHSWETPITRHSWASLASSFPSNILGKMISRGNYFPGTPPSRVPTGWSRHPYVICMLYLAYINVTLLVGSGRIATKMCEIKTEKHTTPAGHQPQSIPLNAVLNRCKLNEQCSISEYSIASSHHAPDRVSFWGMSGFLCLRPDPPLPFAIGGHTIG